MNEPLLVETLGRMHFLEDAAPEELRRLASAARLEEYGRGAVVFREGQRLARIFLVAEGSVSLESCLAGKGCHRIQTVGPGELLGWSPVLSRAPMTATARAQSATRLVALDAERVLALCAQDPTFGVFFLRRTALALADRLYGTRQQLLELCRHQLPFVPAHEGAD
jgi:CRP-like cAMP-binding protein